MLVGAWYGRAFVVAGALAALVPAAFMWGFTVDDALISIRYAHHLATGIGYRFDPGGAPTDGVTPLPWAPLIAPLASVSDLVVALERVKLLGILAWAAAAAALGGALAKTARGERGPTILAIVALVVVALAFPIGAWAASGMETGVVTALATLAIVTFARPTRSAALAGVAASFRPELVPWALVVALGAALSSTACDAAAEPAPVHAASFDAKRVRAVVLGATFALGPFAGCTIVRLFVFGRPAPLALLAKPSDLEHGLVYAAAAVLVVLTPILAFAPFALRRASASSKTVALATVVHGAVVVAVGGDWMPYARLFVPVAPALALVFVDVGSAAHLASTGLRTVLAVSLGAYVAIRSAAPGRHVHEDRKALVVRAREVLAPARVVAALDIGWVTAATEASIVDLAGLTDPTIAVLSGGHTSKAVDVSMLLDRRVDTVVAYCEPRIVERRLLAAPLFHERFALATTLPLGTRGQCYRVYRRR